jgi:uncharacterized protein YukE
MPNYNEIIEQSQVNIKSLSDKLKDLDKLHQDIVELKNNSALIPELFEKKFQEIFKLSNEYTEVLGKSTMTYLDGNNTLFTSKINEFSEKNIELKKQISRLINTDLKKLFNNLQKEFIGRTKADLEVEYKKIDSRVNDFQVKIDSFGNEINRLERVDLEKLFKQLQNKFIKETKEELEKELEKIDAKTKEFQVKLDNFSNEINRLESVDLEQHFAKHQKTLSEIFSAINTINLTLTGITNSLNSINQSLGQIQKSISDNFDETKKSVKEFRESISNHLKKQDEKSDEKIGLLKDEIAILGNQNTVLQKQITLNRVIQIIGIVLIIGFLIFMVVKK